MAEALMCITIVPSTLGLTMSYLALRQNREWAKTIKRCDYLADRANAAESALLRAHLPSWLNHTFKWPVEERECEKRWEEAGQ
jgi:hypothetical protein